MSRLSQGQRLFTPNTPSNIRINLPSQRVGITPTSTGVVQQAPNPIFDQLSGVFDATVANIQFNQKQAQVSQAESNKEFTDAIGRLSGPFAVALAESEGDPWDGVSFEDTDAISLRMTEITEGLLRTAFPDRELTDEEFTLANDILAQQVLLPSITSSLRKRQSLLTDEYSATLRLAQETLDPEDIDKATELGRQLWGDAGVELTQTKIQPYQEGGEVATRRADLESQRLDILLSDAPKSMQAAQLEALGRSLKANDPEVQGIRSSILSNANTLNEAAIAEAKREMDYFIQSSQLNAKSIGSAPELDGLAESSNKLSNEIARLRASIPEEATQGERERWLSQISAIEKTLADGVDRYLANTITNQNSILRWQMANADPEERASLLVQAKESLSELEARVSQEGFDPYVQARIRNTITETLTSFERSFGKTGKEKLVLTERDFSTALFTENQNIYTLFDVALKDPSRESIINYNEALAKNLHNAKVAPSPANLAIANETIAMLQNNDSPMTAAVRNAMFHSGSKDQQELVIGVMSGQIQDFDSYASFELIDTVPISEELKERKIPAWNEDVVISTLHPSSSKDYKTEQAFSTKGIQRNLGTSAVPDTTYAFDMQDELTRAVITQSVLSRLSEVSNVEKFGDYRTVVDNAFKQGIQSIAPNVVAMSEVSADGTTSGFYRVFPQVPEHIQGNYTSHVTTLTMYAAGRGPLPLDTPDHRVPARYESNNFGAFGLYQENPIERIVFNDLDGSGVARLEVPQDLQEFTRSDLSSVQLERMSQFLEELGFVYDEYEGSSYTERQEAVLNRPIFVELDVNLHPDRRREPILTSYRELEKRWLNQDGTPNWRALNQEATHYFREGGSRASRTTNYFRSRFVD